MPHKYPGWNLDLRWFDQQQEPMFPTGIHYNCWGADSEMLTVGEVAMMLVMDRLTDKPDWHIKVFDDEIAQKWRQEALTWPEDDLWNRTNNAMPYRTDFWDEADLQAFIPERPKKILTEEAVDYCILELRQKAEYFKETGIIPTLDATFSVAKSDVLVTPELHATLRDAFAQLKADQAKNPDWHPNTNETVQDLVHPSMYPLIYGRSRFFEDEVVGVEDAIDKYAGKGVVIPQRPEWDNTPSDESARRYGSGTNIGGSGVHRSYWSTVYQWLPANVKFTPEGGVQFTSCINNLHPNKYPGIYKTIEKLIETALPLWDQCLVQRGGDGYDVTPQHSTVAGPGRRLARIQPVNPDDENPENWDPQSVEKMLEMEAAAADAGQAVEVSAEEAKQDLENGRWAVSGNAEDFKNHGRWIRTRRPVQPVPLPFEESKVRSYAVNPEKTLRNQFKDTGLQIIVKMASIELTPEKPEFSPGGWHVEGQMNEHIVATALYYLDSENITDSYLDFRTLTSSYQDDWDVGQDSYKWMESVYGAKLGGTGSSCLQNYGSVLTRQGRLLAFQNVFHHRVSGFRLADPTKPGHRRFIALWLVDPLTRVINTGNVPPQQAEWWEDKVFGSDQVELKMYPEIAQLMLERGLGKDKLEEAMAEGKLPRGRLPNEIMDILRKEFDGPLPMTRTEAEQHRLALMEERSAFQSEAREHYASVEYSFCEH